MSGVSSDQAVPIDTTHKWRERLLIVAALALVICRLISVRNSIAAMVVATIVLIAVFTCYVRGWPWGRTWAFCAALPLAIAANVAALAVGIFVTYLAENSLLVQNRLGLHSEWNRLFLCLPLAALVNLLAWGWPHAGRQLWYAAWVANGVLLLYAGGLWRLHDEHQGFGGAPPFGSELFAALAAISMMTLSWDPKIGVARSSSVDTSSSGRRRPWRTGIVVTITLVTGAVLFVPFRTVLRRCRLEAALTALGCEVTDRTRRPAPLRIRELAPLRPYVTDIEAVYLSKECLTPATCQAIADVLGQVTMLDELDARAVPAGCEKLLSRLGQTSYMQYLTLRGAGVTDDALATAGGFNRLRHAVFSQARISDAGLAHLAGLPWLEVLVLRDTPVTGEGLAPLAACPTLRILDLSGTQIGDEQSAVLQQLPRLCRVDLTGTRMTAGGIEQLRAALPQCDIQWSPAE